MLAAATPPPQPIGREACSLSPPVRDTHAAWGVRDGLTSEIWVSTADTQSDDVLSWSAEIVAKAGSRVERWDQSLGETPFSSSMALELVLPDTVFVDVLSDGHLVHVYANLYGRTADGRLVQRHQLRPMYLGLDPATDQHVFWSKAEALDNTTYGTFAALDAGTLAALAEMPEGTMVRPFVPAAVVTAPDQAPELAMGGE